MSNHHKSHTTPITSVATPSNKRGQDHENLVVVMFKVDSQSVGLFSDHEVDDGAVHVYERDRLDPRVYMGLSLKDVPYFDDFTDALRFLLPKPPYVRICQLSLRAARRRWRRTTFTSCG